MECVRPSEEFGERIWVVRDAKRVTRYIPVSPVCLHVRLIREIFASCGIDRFLLLIVG